MALINFSGLASGIDSNALIQATSDATRKSRVNPKQKKIDELTATNDRFDELETKLNTLRANARALATISGGAVAKTATSSNEAVATATASPAALTGSYSLTVSQLAKSATYSFSDRFATTSTVIDSSINDGLPADPDRTMSFTIGNGTNQQVVKVTMTSTMTVADFVQSFNTATTKATASVVNVGTESAPSYAIMITTNNSGTDKGQIVSVSRGIAISNLNPASATHDAAANAQFTVSGISGTISRPSNKISDVISGVTFDLTSTSGTAVTVNIADDPETTTTNVKKVIDSFNDIVTFLRENNTITREENGQNVENVFGPLAATRTDETAMQSLRDAIATNVFSGGSSIRILADLGITTERDGTLRFDESKFKTGVASEANSANSVMVQFFDRISITGGTIDVITRFNGTLDTTVNSNKTIIQSLNEQIAQAEASIAQTEATMRRQFSRLESIVGRLQNQQQALSSALAGLAR